MVDTEIDTPPGWEEQTGEERRGDTICGYQYVTDEEVRFVVSVLEPAVYEDTNRLRFATVDPTGTHIRQDYPVEEYESIEAAIRAAESLIEHISLRLEEGSISASEPEVASIRDAIQDFTGHPLFPSLQHLIRRLR